MKRYVKASKTLGKKYYLKNQDLFDFLCGFIGKDLWLKLTISYESGKVMTAFYRVDSIAPPRTLYHKEVGKRLNLTEISGMDLAIYAKSGQDFTLSQKMTCDIPYIQVQDYYEVYTLDDIREYAVDKYCPKISDDGYFHIFVKSPFDHFDGSNVFYGDFTLDEAIEFAEERLNEDHWELQYTIWDLAYKSLSDWKKGKNPVSQEIVWQKSNDKPKYNWSQRF